MFELLVAADDRHRLNRRWCVVRRDEVLVRATDHPSLELVDDQTIASLATVDGSAHFLGMLGDAPVWAIGVEPTVAAPGPRDFVHLRQISVLHDEQAWMIGARAVQLVEWARSHRYCGACATPTEPVPRDRAMRCPGCGLLAYPRLSPAVIMAVHRGPDLLLARGRRGSWPVHSTLAGFVEPGETLEHAVRREVREEVGVTVGDVTYFGSQAWPFPNSLMVGFFAEYAGGEIVIDPNEIAEARWFRPDEIPTFPSTFSIAVRLIRAHLARHT